MMMKGPPIILLSIIISSMWYCECQNVPLPPIEPAIFPLLPVEPNTMIPLPTIEAYPDTFGFPPIRPTRPPFPSFPNWTLSNPFFWHPKPPSWPPIPPIWHPRPGRRCFERTVRKIQRFRQLWRDNVPELPNVPDFPANIGYGRRKLRPNESILTEHTMARPWIKWSSAISGDMARGALYSVLMIDVSIRMNMTYIHWLKTNIDGTNTYGGDESMEYGPTFAFRSCHNGTTNHGEPCEPEDEGMILDVPGYTHVFAAMVFRQGSGRIELDDNEKQVGCNPTLLNSTRFTTFDWIDAFVDKYSLVLEAGTFFRNPYSGIVDRLICKYTSCTVNDLGPFPALIPGVNDLDECAPFEGDPDDFVDWVGLLDYYP